MRFLALATLFASAASVSAQPCQSGFDPAVPVGFLDIGGIANPQASTVFDSGDGPMVYVGGFFPYVAEGPDPAADAYTVRIRPNGSIERVGQPLGGLVRDILGAALPGGNTLFAAGEFEQGVVRFDGFSWVPLDPANHPVGPVFKLLVHDDGSGPALYAAGRFTLQTPSGPASNIARWTGSQWQPVGNGVSVSADDQAIYALASWDDDGPGPDPAALYAGGYFANASQQRNLVRWDGQSWSQMPLPGQTHYTISGLVAYDPDGAGPQLASLYASGVFYSDNSDVDWIARWNGSGWDAVGGGAASAFTLGGPKLTVLDEPQGPTLWLHREVTSAGGLVASGAARWNGASWSIPGSVGRPQAVAVDSQERVVIVSQSTSPTSSGHLFFLHPDQSITYGNGGPHAAFDATDSPALHFNVGQDASGSDFLLVSGSFTEVGNQSCRGVAVFNGTAWSVPAPFASSVNLSPPIIGAALVDAGSGPTWFAARSSGVSRWDGAFWQPDSPGVTAAKRLKTFDVPGMPRGPYIVADHPGVLYRGSNGAWQTVPYTYGVNDFTLADLDGPGPDPIRIIVAGRASTTPNQFGVFYADGNNLVRLGANWISMPLAVIYADDGTGPALYATGGLYASGVNGLLYRWSGSAWQSVTPPGMFLVYPSDINLIQFDDGDGPAIWVSGNFDTPDGQARGLARFRNGQWTTFGPVRPNRPINAYALGVFNNDLYIGGDFHPQGDPAPYTFAGFPADNMIRFRGCAGSCLADYNGSGGTPDDADIAAFLLDWNNGDSRADLNYSGGTPDDADVAVFFSHWTAGC